MRKQNNGTPDDYVYYNNGVFRIAIDCDDTIMIFARKYWETHNKKFNDSVKYKKIKKWGFVFYVKASVTLKDTLETLYEKDLFRHLRLRRGAYKLMDTLFKENFSIYLVTDVPEARKDINPRQDRLNNIKDKFPWYDLSKVEFTPDKDQTGLGFLLYLDDKPEMYFKLIAQGKNVILMDAPHNRYIKDVKYRATNLEQALEFSLEIKEEYIRSMNQ